MQKHRHYDLYEDLHFLVPGIIHAYIYRYEHIANYLFVVPSISIITNNLHLFVQWVLCEILLDNNQVNLVRYFPCQSVQRWNFYYYYLVLPDHEYQVIVSYWVMIFHFDSTILDRKKNKQTDQSYLLKIKVLHWSSNVSKLLNCIRHKVNLPDCVAPVLLAIE